MLIGVLSFFTKRVLWIYIIGFSFFLLVMPPTGEDYTEYERAYQLSYWVGEYPFIKTRSSITAEFGYIIYQGAISLFSGLDYQGFLVINFLVCILIILFSNKMLRLKYLNAGLLVLFLAPVIAPILFYWSPRSSISFSLVYLGFCLLIKDKWFYAILFYFLGIMIHSQFILVVTFSLLGYWITNNQSIKYAKLLILLCSILLAIFLLNISLFLNGISSLLSFLPSAIIAINKLHYIEDSQSTGIRLTGLLSIFIFPSLTYYLMKVVAKGKKLVIDIRTSNKFVILLFTISCLGAAINISFWGDAHLAGRLSRFSDYVGFLVILPLFSHIYFGRNVTVGLAIILILLAPVLYGSLY